MYGISIESAKKVSRETIKMPSSVVSIKATKLTKTNE
jgi:hypothetical protein